jgi:hypothetical protein
MLVCPMSSRACVPCHTPIASPCGVRFRPHRSRRHLARIPAKYFQGSIARLRHQGHISHSSSMACAFFADFRQMAKKATLCFQQLAQSSQSSKRVIFSALYGLRTLCQKHRGVGVPTFQKFPNLYSLRRIIVADKPHRAWLSSESAPRSDQGPSDRPIAKLLT